MSQNNNGGFDLTDPMGLWRAYRDANLEAWAKGMSSMVGTDTFAQMLGMQLNTMLATSLPLQKMIEQAMEQYLARMNLPSRAEVINLSQRMTNLEMRLDDLDAKSDQILQTVHAQAPVIVEMLEERFAQGFSVAPAGDQAEATPAEPLTLHLKKLEERTEALLHMVQDLHQPRPEPAATVTARSRKRPLKIEETPPTPQEEAEDKALSDFENSVS